MWRRGVAFVSSSRRLHVLKSPSDFLSPSGSRILSTSAFASSSSSASPETVSPRYPVVLPSKFNEIADAARHYGRCYWELSKARLSMLVVATSGTGYVLGSSSSIDFANLCYTCAGTMMVAASANSLNQIFEIQNDARMKRTLRRPLPSGRITVPHAFAWTSIAGIAGTSLLAWKANILASGLAASNLALYAFIYTPLKQIHPVNTWVGAVVGAIPPLLGWVAASGEISRNSMILPAALYFWQIPHFMALAYLCRNDYSAGGFRMFSLTDASGRRTALVSLRNCLYLLPLGYLTYDWGISSKWVFYESSLLTLGMTAAAIKFLHDRNPGNARKMFHASLLYLPVFMSGLLLHRLPNENNESIPVTDDNLHEATIFEGAWNLKSNSREKPMEYSLDRLVRPPVAHASVAPFPFLPAPLYIHQES